MLSLYRLVCAVTLLWLRILVAHVDTTGFGVRSFTPPAAQQSKGNSNIFITQINMDVATSTGAGPPQDQSLRTKRPHPNDEYHTNLSINQFDKSRRDVFKTTYHSFNIAVAAAVTLTTTTTILTPTSAAYALQPRNELFCSTGLFEHFMEYKCTPIGDILDEGVSKELTNVEEQTTDSLLSKLGIDDDTSRFTQEKVNKDETASSNSKLMPK